jgi:hypothetical protein
MEDIRNYPAVMLITQSMFDLILVITQIIQFEYL